MLAAVVMALTLMTGSAHLLTLSNVIRAIATSIVVFPFLVLVGSPMIAPHRARRPMVTVPTGVVALGLFSGVAPVPEFFLVGRVSAIGAAEIGLRVVLFGAFGLLLAFWARREQGPKAGTAES